MHHVTPARTNLPAVVRVDHAQRWRELVRCSSAEARSHVPYQTAHKYNLLPMTLINAGEGRMLLTALSAQDFSADSLRELRFAIGCEVIHEQAHGPSVERAIHAAYIGDMLTARKSTTSPSAADIVEDILRQSVALGASDIHIESTPEGSVVRFRVDGSLRSGMLLRGPAGSHQNIARRIQILANLSPSETGEAREGSFAVLVGLKQIHFRLSTVGCIQGEKIALRVLGNDAYAVDDCRSWSAAEALLVQFGMTTRQIQLLRAAVSRKSGSIVVGGPTGSGKSTLLHLLVGVLAGEGLHIVTIEDPVERRLSGVSQIPVRRESGQTFADVLPLVLRQDPDIIMVGEVRDRQTAETALSAGLTGHLVLSTVHAASALEVVERFRQLRVADELLASSIQLIAAQRLVPKNCLSCSRPRPADQYELRALHLPPELKIRESYGCEVCEGSGHLGRVGAYEMFPLHGEFRDIALSNLSPQQKQQHLEQLLHKVQLPSLAARMRMHVVEGTVAPHAALAALGLLRGTKRAA